MGLFIDGLFRPLVWCCSLGVWWVFEFCLRVDMYRRFIFCFGLCLGVNFCEVLAGVSPAVGFGGSCLWSFWICNCV